MSKQLVRDPMSKHWCFTLNNYTEVDYAQLLGAPHDYVVIGKEVGENGTPHLQGYIIFVNRKRLSGCKKINPRAHWEMKSKNSTVREAAEYCKKDGKFFEDGNLPDDPHIKGGEATREKWADALASAKVNKLDDIQPKMLITHYQTFKRIAQDYQKVPPDLNGVCGVWFHGPPRTGKSRAARDLYPGAYDKPCNKWWDGYRDHPFVIIDDFDKNHEVLGHHLKRWADRYSFPAEHKGHTYQIRPQKIIVTSNYSIEEIFGKDPVLTQALQERFQVTIFSHSPFNKYCSKYDRENKSPWTFAPQKRTIVEVVDDPEVRNVKKKIINLTSSSSSGSSESDESSESSSDDVSDLEDESENSQPLTQPYNSDYVPDTPPLSPRRNSEKKVTIPDAIKELYDMDEESSVRVPK